MATFLVAWSPKKWRWNEATLDKQSAMTRKGGKVAARWSFGRSAKAQPGDRVFLIKLGESPKGLVASGHIIAKPTADEHYADADKPPQFYAQIQWDYLVNGYKTVVVSSEELKDAPFSKQLWSTQSSGISIKPDVAAALERLWAERTGIAGGSWMGEENLGAVEHIEGGKSRVVVNRFERDPAARAACIAQFGSKCSVCAVDLEAVYGAAAAGFIHVHHIRPLATTGKTKVDPKKDLRPVCPNCHAIIHRGDPAFSIEMVRGFIRQAKRHKSTSAS